MTLTCRGAIPSSKVEADYVPARYRGAPRQPHDVLVGEMIAVLGRDRALELDMLAQANKLMLVSSPDRRDAMQEYRARLDAMTRSMGAEFAQRYEASLEALIEEMRRAQEARAVRLDWWNDPASMVPRSLQRGTAEFLRSAHRRDYQGHGTRSNQAGHDRIHQPDHPRRGWSERSRCRRVIERSFKPWSGPWAPSLRSATTRA